VTPESVVALAYLAASALVIVVLSSPRIAQEAHEVGDLLFGNAVVVKHADLVRLAVAAGITLTLHGLFFKEFLFSSFDGDTARVSGIPVRLMDFLLHLSLALCVAMATGRSARCRCSRFWCSPRARRCCCRSGSRWCFCCRW